MIKLKDILLEARLDILKPRRSKEERDKKHIIAVQRQIQNYIKNSGKDGLDLNDAPIKSLPDKLTKVDGSLYLKNTQIESLPDNLTVDGNLDLEKHSFIKTLSNNLTVKGFLDISSTQIKTLPNNLTVGGNFYLINTPIELLPENLTVGGEFVIINTPLDKKYTDEEIRKLANINGKIIREYILLESDELDILKLRRGKEERHKNYLIAVQKKIQNYIKNGMVGDLDLKDAPIQSLPDNLTRVGGNLNLSNTFHINKLPDNLTEVDGDLTINYTSIKELPDNLKVGGNLSAEGIPMQRLPNNLTVGKSLFLSYSSIRTLTDNLTVGGDLNLFNTLITTLPDNLTVNGNLNMRNTWLDEIPKNLKVAGNIILVNTPLVRKYFHNRTEIKKLLPDFKGFLVL